MGPPQLHRLWGVRECICDSSLAGLAALLGMQPSWASTSSNSPTPGKAACASLHCWPNPAAKTVLNRKKTYAPLLIRSVLTYLVLAVLLAGSIYGVARVARGSGGSSGGAASIDILALNDALMDNARVGGARGGAAAAARAQQQQQQHSSGQQHLHEDVHDRRAALEQHHLQQAAAAGEADGLEQQQAQQQGADSGAGLTQEQLEFQHLQELQLLEQQHALAAQRAADEQQQGQEGGVLAAAQLQEAGTQEHVAAHIAAQQALPRREGPTLYSANLSAVDIRGNVMHTADLMGKVTLIVNVASQCGYTEANYAGLHRMYERYKHYGLEVLAFPCNQFGGQEPGSHAEIEAFVQSHFHATFPLFSKVEVNGPTAHPVFTWLKLNTPPLPGHRSGEAVEWNFAKFLVDKYGHPVKRYPSALDYHDLELDVYNELIRV